ncbi:MAG TPA: DUF58 domain-containing protein [Polyangiaceae bacterium]
MRPLNLAKLNHILIPQTKTARDRFRDGRFGRVVAPLTGFYEALSDEGRLVASMAFVFGGFALDVRHTEIYVVWCALVALVVASIALRRGYRLDDVRVEVEVPRRVTVAEEMRFAFVVRNDGARDHRALRVRGPFLPWDGKWIGDMPRVRRLAPGATARVEVGCRFAERGEHHLDSFSAAALVPLGLSLGRPLRSTGCRLLVVPKIARVERLALPTGRRHQPGGVALASKTGESMDLLGVRPYRAGDAVRDLHAKSWARLGVPVVREYQEEYFSRIGVVVDTAVEAAEAGGAKDPERLLEAAVSLAAGVVAHLSRGEALIDLLVAGGRVHELTLGRSLGFLDQALDLLACVKPGPRLDPDAMVERLATHLTRLSCVIVIALGHDDGELAERIRGYGVACTVIAVGDRNAARDRESKTVAAESIERGEALAL